jgi:hypothetical protein
LNDEFRMLFIFRVNNKFGVCLKLYKFDYKGVKNIISLTTLALEVTLIPSKIANEL